MSGIRTASLPADALLAVYARGGAYTDCFVAAVPAPVTHEQYVAAFYTTWVFRLERTILRWAVARPSTDVQALQLAAGTRDDFAAWHVEARTPDQLLLRDFTGRTRSWLMMEPAGDGTRLYFGSAVVPVAGAEERSTRLVSSTMLCFHKLYSRILLRAARSRLLASIG
jgi:hypothetical protein